MKDKAVKRVANRLRDKRRRKRKHARQIESRLKNEYTEYITKMNNFEYNTWLSQVTSSEEEDKIYCSQVSNKEKFLNELKKHGKYVDLLLNTYDIVENSEILQNNTISQEKECIIS